MRFSEKVLKVLGLQEVEFIPEVNFGGVQESYNSEQLVAELEVDAKERRKQLEK